VRRLAESRIGPERTAEAERKRGREGERAEERRTNLQVRYPSPYV